jgi:hypothetical protein
MKKENLKFQKILESNKKEWDEMPILGMHVDINLVRCQKRLFGEAKNKKILYIGFGEGQNLEYLAREGFEVYGTEIAKSRLNYALAQMKAKKLRSKLFLVDSNKLPFKDNFLCSTLSSKHSLCAKKVGQSLYRPKIKLQKQCLIYALDDEKQIRDKFKKFRNIQIGFYSSSLFKTFDYHYVIFCNK